MQEKRIEIIVVGVIVLWITILISFLGVVLFVYQRRHYKILNQLEEEKNRHESEILRSQLEMQEETLQHIARELHDNIGQYITIAKLYMNSIRLDLDPGYSTKLGYAVDMLTKALEDMRNLSKSLSLELIRTEGLGRAIESHLDQLRKTEQYSIEFEIKGTHNYLEEQKEIIMFRILQEAINNVVKHAQAQKIEVVLDYDANGTRLKIVDDGKGFEIDGLASEGKIGKRIGGINNMRARAAIIGAEFMVASRPGYGTSINLAVPLDLNFDFPKD